MSTVVKLDDYLEKDDGQVFVTGPQAWWLGTRVVRWADAAAVHPDGTPIVTRTELSGYPGSPFAGVITIGHQLGAKLKKLGIFFNASLNEFSAVDTALGNQRIARYGGMIDGVKVDGISSFVVFKGPGLDQSWDGIENGVVEGASKFGGVVLGIGDDTQGSSTATWTDSKEALQAKGVVVLTPSSVDEIPEYLLYANHLSRHSGCWVAITLTSEIAEASGIVDLGKQRALQVRMPKLREAPVDEKTGRATRSATRTEIPIDPKTGRSYNLNNDRTLSRHDRGILKPHRKIAATDFVDENFLNHTPKGWEGGEKPTIGIAAPGVSYSHVRAALRELGIDETKAAELGIKLLKVGAPSLISERTIVDFSQNVDKIMVVEELNDGTERNFRNAMGKAVEASRIKDKPIEYKSVYGRTGEDGEPLLPATAHDVFKVAQAIAKMIGNPEISARAASLDQRVKDASAPLIISRGPTFCGGCPHSQGTRGLFGGITRNDDEDIVIGGNGCFTLASEGFSRELERAGAYSHMGGEDTAIGILRYMAKKVEDGEPPKTRHITQLVGDGTAFHSSFRAVQAVKDFETQHPELGVSLTFKVLNNGTTAMTGGQPLPPNIKPGKSLYEKKEYSSVRIAQEMATKGIRNISIVTDGDWIHRMALRWEARKVLPRGTHLEIVSDRHLAREGRRLKDDGGVNALIYESECATEKRRRRARGKESQPDTLVVVNQEVCENCGDCDITSGGCTAVQKKQTAHGPKTAINQNICNVDYSCTTGFCPSFVLVKGKRRKFKLEALKKTDKDFDPDKKLATPTTPVVDGSYSILTPGIGGLGATTVGRIIGQAVDIQNKLNPDAAQLGYVGYDATGLAQKGGPVIAHSTILNGRTSEDFTSRISTAQLVLGCDPVVLGTADNLARIDRDTTVVILNTHVEPVYADKFNPPSAERDQAFVEHIRKFVHPDRFHAFNASAVSTFITGNTLAANNVILGYAYQKGLTPLTHQAITESIRLNGTAVEANLAAFEMGRRCADDPEIVKKIEAFLNPKAEIPRTLDERIELNARMLEEFQDAAYATFYRNLVERVRVLDASFDEELHRKPEDRHTLTEAVVDNLFKVMCWKDEFRVSQLLASPKFKAELDLLFEPGYSTTNLLAPPVTGLKSKIALPGAITQPLFKILAGAKGYRDTRWDLFKHTTDRKIDRERRGNYIALLEDMLTDDNGGTKIKAQNYGLAVGFAGIAQKVAGFGHVKAKAHAEHPIPVTFTPNTAAPRVLAA